MGIVSVILLLLLISIFIYNGLVRKRNNVENAFSTIDVMLKKRFDLIPNLVEVVKQYSSYEQETLKKIVELREQEVEGNLSTTERASIDREIGQTMKQMMVRIENYPELKANANYLNLQSTWTESEEQIAAARRAYNSNVTGYNNSVMQFPGNMLAGLFGFTKHDLLESAAEERQNLNAKDLFNS